MSAVAPFRHTAYPVRVFAGDDALANLKDAASRTGAQRPFVVCGQSVATRTDLLERVADALGKAPVGVFDGVQAGSPAPSVMRGVQLARDADADLIIAVGGGSAVVTARAIIIMLAEGGNPADHATKYPAGQPPVSPRLMAPKLPNILVLTTPTTAATRAGTAVIDGETGHRLEMFDPKTRPAAVIWDTAALLTAPAELCVSASGSLLSGVVGALQAPRLNALAAADLYGALNLLRENLPAVPVSPDGGADGDAPDAGTARVNLCAAAFLYNRAWDTGANGAALGVVSALAHSLDTRYAECSHGAAYSITTAPGMRFNRDSNLAGQGRLADALGLRGAGMSDVDAADSASDWVAGFFGRVGMPTRLREAGVPADGIGQIAEDALTDFGLHRNVRPVRDAEELAELLAGVW